MLSSFSWVWELGLRGFEDFKCGLMRYHGNLPGKEVGFSESETQRKSCKLGRSCPLLHL